MNKLIVHEERSKKVKKKEKTLVKKRKRKEKTIMSVKEYEVRMLRKGINGLKVIPVRELTDYPVTISAASDTAAFADEALDMFMLPEERAYAIYSKATGEISGVIEIGRGQLTETPINVAKTLQGALLLNAASVIMVHNHPSGNVQPSTADIGMMHQMKAALRLFQITLLDSVIVGGEDDYFSMKGNSYLF